jgi:predicted dehydrogenase
MAERHAAAFKEIKGVEIIGFCDLIEENAKALGKKFNVSTFTEYSPLLKQGVDFVDVCTPTPSHKRIILDALNAGAHVFCEKPLASDALEVEEILDASRDKKLTVQVGYVYRFHPAFSFLKKEIDSNTIGKPHLVTARLGGRGGHRKWKHLKSQGGGAILDMAVHMIDLCNWLFGEPKAELLYSSTLLPERIIEGKLEKVDAEDAAVIKLEYDKVTAIIESDLVSPAFTNTFEVHGDNGTIFTSIIDFIPSFIYLKQARNGFEKGYNFLKQKKENMILLELAHFVKVMKGEAEPANPIKDSLKIARVLESLKE